MSLPAATRPSPATLNCIKRSLRLFHDDILENWISRIKSRPPNTPEIMTYLIDQQNCAGVEMMKLMATVFSLIEYKPMHEYMIEFRNIARQIEEKVAGRDFYLVMGCGQENTSQWYQPLSKPKEDKSNYFMFVLLMCVRPSLIESFVDFACVDHGTIKPVHEQNNDDVGVVVFMDDAAFTGMQAATSLSLWNPSPRELIYGSVYMSQEALDGLVEMFTRHYAKHTVFTSAFRPRLINKKFITAKYLEKTDTPLDAEVLARVFGNLGMLTDEMSYLFYNDLKVPDETSVFRAIIPITRLVESHGDFEGQYKNERGHVRFDSEMGRSYMIIPGIVEDTVYKTREWMEFVEKLKTRENLKRRR